MGFIQFIKDKYEELVGEEYDEDYEEYDEDGEDYEEEEDDGREAIDADNAAHISWNTTEEIDYSKLPRLEKVDLNRFSKEDLKNYVVSQCDIMEEATKEIGRAQQEYDSVTSYYSDIQLIETAPEALLEEIKETAEKVAEYMVDRRIYKSGENKLSQRAFYRMERIEPLMPDLLIEIQNNEAYYETVRKDMKMLEGEQMAHRYDARDLVRRQRNIRSTAKVSIIGLMLVFVVFTIASILMGEIGGLLYTIILTLAALIAIGLYATLRATEKQVLITEIKLNKATNLLNKVKIKYINCYNTMSYQRSKYGIKDAYELSTQYELYLQVKKEQNRVSKMTSQLNDAEVKLESLLRQLHLYDVHIWLAQVKALVDSKEMVEVRHGLSNRRRNLRMQVEYNKERITDAKENITRAALHNPELKAEVLEIVERYEDNE